MDNLFVANPCSAQLNAIHQISSALFAKVDVDEMLRETLNVSIRTTDAEAGTIYLYDPQQDRLVFRHIYGPAADHLIGATVSPDSEARCATVFRTGVTEINHTGFDRAFDEQSGYHTERSLTSAIRNFGGQPIGVIQVLNKRTGQFDLRDRELMEIVSALAATVIENAQRAETEKQMALARVESEKHAALSRVLGFIGHQLKNQALIMEMARETFGQPIAGEITALEARNVPKAAALLSDFNEMLTMLRSATDKAIRQAMVINEYGERRDLFEFKPNDLKTVLEEELEQLADVARKHGDTLDLSGLRAVPIFAFEAFFVAQAVFNLAHNAFEAFRQGGQGHVVRVCTEAVEEGRFPDGHYVEITVSDDGPGMSAEKLALILRGEAESDKPRGKGVGTRLVLDVALTHGGQFMGESTPGAGTTFRIRLPLTRS
jgi:signal transduction histidine kinase